MKWSHSLLCAGAVFLAACTAEQTEEGEMPNVDVNVSDSAQLPEYDVDPANVNVGTDTSRVVTPDVDVEPARTTD